MEKKEMMLRGLDALAILNVHLGCNAKTTNVFSHTIAMVKKKVASNDALAMINVLVHGFATSIIV